MRKALRMSPQEKKKMFKSALGVFSFGAAVVYLAAIAYCIQTGNNFAAALLGTAIAGLGIMVVWILKTAKF